MPDASSSDTSSSGMVCRAYAAFNRGDAPALAELLADNVVLRQPGALGGEYHGVEAVLGFYDRLASETHGTIRCELQRVMTSDDRVVAVHKATGRRHGRLLDTAAALVVQVRGGRAVAIDICQEDQEAWDAFWSQPSATERTAE